jgi:c-di-GMP-binding flagellar brake protein YcgR
VEPRGARGGGGVSRLPLPAVGTVVHVSLGDGAPTWKTRVEWVGETSMCVVAPLRSAGEPLAMANAQPLEVVWSNERGILQASGSLRAIEHDVVDLLVLDVVRVERSQRREAFRLPLVVPITLRIGARSVAGETRDLSETGVRCRVASRGGPELLDDVEVALAIADQPPLVLIGRVVRARALTRTPAQIASEGPAQAQTELGIALLDPDPGVTDRLRRYVFDEQLRRRTNT